MSPEQFQDLYKMLRGSRAATVVLDARALHMDGKYKLAEKALSEARESFSTSRARLMRLPPEKQVDPKARDVERQIKKVKRKQEKTQEALEAFDELLPQLKRLATRQEREEQVRAEAQQPPASDDSAANPDESTQPGVAAASSDLHDELRTALAGAKGDARVELINQNFGFREVSSEIELVGESLYFIQMKGMALLVVTPKEDELGDSIQLRDALAKRPIKPFSKRDFLKLGASRKMVLLTRKEPHPLASAPDAPDCDTGMGPDCDTGMEGAPAVTANGEHEADPNPDGEVASNVLDLGAFSQLLTSAQRSGLVPGADQIGYVRDREFRMGKYDLAFQTIDQMFSRFTSSAGQRLQRLTREDADIAAGRIKISPKDLQAKRARDRTQTQEIDRTKRRFQVVLEGLRVLMNEKAPA